MADPIKIGLQFQLLGSEGVEAWVKGLIKLLSSLGIDTSKLNVDEIVNDFKKLASEQGNVNKALDDTERNLHDVEDAAGRAGQAFQFNNVLSQTQAVADALKEVIDVGVEFEASLAEVSAITGKSGAELEALGEKARELAVQFGGSASDQLKGFTGILSKLGPEMADDAAAMGKLVENVNILSKASGDDAATSMNAMVDTMLQLGLATGTASDQANASTDVINALAAGAQVGAATIPQVAQSLLQVGVAAKGANLGLVETNAAIQVLSKGGKTGSEAGVALRNVLGFIQKASGPAEAAMNKLGTSSKELGEILTTQGLGPAITKLRDGLGKLETDAQRNVAMMDIFGTENAAAAGILIDNIDLLDTFSTGIEAGLAGQGSAFEQAAINMGTTQSAMERMQAFIEDQFISAFQVLGSGVSSVLGTLANLGPTVVALSALKDIFPVKGALEFGKAILAKVVPGLFVQVAATEAGTAAQLKFNAAALLNPWLAGGALLFAGIIGAIALFSDKTKDAKTAVEDLNKAQEDYNAAVDNQKAVQKQADSLTKLADDYDRLKDSTDPKDQEKFAIVSEQLATKVGFASEQFDKLNDKGQIIGKTFQVATDEVRQFANEQVELAKQGAEEALQRLNDQAAALGQTYLKQKEDIAEARDEVKKYKDAVDEGLGNVAIGLDWESAGENLKDARLELGKLSGEQDQVVKKARQFISAGLEGGKTIEELAEVMGVPVEEAQKLSAGLDDANAAADTVKGPVGEAADEIGRAADEARKMGEEFEAARKKASDFAGAAVAALAQALAELDAALKTGDQASIDAAREKIKVQEELAKQGVATEKQFNRYYEEAERRAGRRKEKAKKEKKQRDIEEINADEILLETLAELRDEYIIQTSKNELEAKLETLRQQKEAEEEALQKQLDDFSEIKAEQGKKDAKKKLVNEETIEANSQAIRQALEDKYNDLRAKARIESYREAVNLERQARAAELSAEITDLQLQQDLITKESVKGLEDRFEKQKEIIALQQKQDLESLLETNEKIINAETDIQELRAKFAEATTETERQQLQQQIDDKLSALELLKEAELENNRSAQVVIQKYNAEIRKAELDKIKEQYKLEEAALEESLEKQRKEREEAVAATQRLVDDIVRLNEQQGLSIIDSRFADEIKQLEQQREQELIVEEDYNHRRAELERNAQEEREALQARAIGMRLEAERQARIQELEFDKKALEEKRAVAEKIGDFAEVEKLDTQLAGITKSIEDQGNVLSAVSGEIQSNLTEVFSNLFSGDTEKIKEPFKKAFNVLAGALQRLASAKITEVILGSISGLLGLPGLATSIAAKSVVEPIINSLLAPVLDGLTSFGYGGRVDYRQVVVVGDDPQGGDQTEWILRDENIMLMLNASTERVGKAVGEHMDRVVTAIEEKAFAITEREVNDANRRAEQRASKSTLRRVI